MIALTHFLFAYLLSKFLKLSPVLTIFFALLPDLELAFNTFHRGILHSPLILSLLLILIYFFKKEIFIDALTGLSSHLILDSLTFQGLPLTYPLNAIFNSFHFFNTQSFQILLTFIFIVLITSYKGFEIKENHFKIFISIFFLTLLFFGKKTDKLSCAANDFTNLEYLGTFEGEIVKVKGRVCSEIKTGRNYLSFDICSNNGESVFSVKYSTKKPLILWNDFCGRVTDSVLII